MGRRSSRRVGARVQPASRVRGVEADRLALRKDRTPAVRGGPAAAGASAAPSIRPLPASRAQRVALLLAAQGTGVTGQRTRSRPNLCGTSGCTRPRRSRHARYCSDACRARGWKARQARKRQTVPTSLRPAALRLLERLRQGPAPAGELVLIAGWAYPTRLRECHRAGHRISGFVNEWTWELAYWSQEWMKGSR